MVAREVVKKQRRVQARFIIGFLLELFDRGLVDLIGYNRLIVRKQIFYKGYP